MIRDSLIYVIHGDNHKDLVHLLFELTSVSDRISPKELFSPNENVVLKPVVFKTKNSPAGVITDIGLVEQVILELKAMNVKKITVAENAGPGQDTGLAFKLAGYDKLCEKHGVKLVDLKTDTYQTVPVTYNRTKLKQIQIAETILKADKIINLPVLKGHPDVKLSCGMKNLLGVVSDSEIARFKTIGLEQSIFELSTVIKIALNICDAVSGIGHSEDSASAVKFGRVFMGQDLFAFDNYAASALSLDKDEIPYLRDFSEYLGPSEKPRTININQPEDPFEEKPQKDLSRYKSKIYFRNACSKCLPLVTRTLERDYDDKSVEYYVGLGARSQVTNPFTPRIFVGNCSRKNCDSEYFIQGCPPSENMIIKMLKTAKKF